LLEQVGMRADVAVDGLAAVARARERKYALILMDVQMPGLNGIEATRAIRGESRNRDTPILALTANALEEDRRACLDAGMNAHVGKPFNAVTFYEALLHWLPVPTPGGGGAATR
jgi:CheY-like chemotaxis protein